MTKTDRMMIAQMFSMIIGMMLALASESSKTLNDAVRAKGELQESLEVWIEEEDS